MISSIKSISNWEFEPEICDSFQDLSHCWTDFKLGASFYGCRAPISIPNAPCMLYLVNIFLHGAYRYRKFFATQSSKASDSKFSTLHSFTPQPSCSIHAVLRRSMAQSNNFQDDPKQLILSHWAATVGCSSLVLGWARFFRLKTAIFLLAKQFMIPLGCQSAAKKEVFQNSTF